MLRDDKNGARCRKTALKFADRCRHHCQGRERDLTDEKRLPWLRSMALRFPGKRRQAERSIERIFVRRLHRAWQLDPELPGATMRLGPGDEARVERWLIERGVILDDGQRTPRCRDQPSLGRFFVAGRETRRSGRATAYRGCIPGRGAMAREAKTT